MNIVSKSLVADAPAAVSEDANRFFRAKLGYETDPSDVYHDLTHDVADFVILDVRDAESYNKRHVPQAINMPHSKINKSTMADFPPGTLFVVYCWGPGCNGATKAAIKLSKLGYPVKEMIGGIEYWAEHEKYPVACETA